MQMISIDNLTKVYNGLEVLRIDSITINRGESVGLVGNNGAGKTTLFSMILDLIEPTTGEILINGIHVCKSEQWKLITSSFLDESFLIGYLTPEEYFYFIGDLHGLNKESVNEFLPQYSDFFNNEILGNKKYIRDLSKGNQKKVGIIGALIGNPELIILDEPFANLDPSSQFRLKDLINKLTIDKQVTVLISSHDLSHTVEISNRIIALEKGKILKDIKTTSETLDELNDLFSV